VTSELIEQWFDTTAGRMNYAEGGLGDRPVVILHGVTMHWQGMAEIITPLAERAHVYACDLRGHGRSDWADSGYRISDYVEDIAGFVRAKSQDGTVLIGFSLGAQIAFGVAATVPDLVAGVVAIEPALILRDSDFAAIAGWEAHGWISWVDDVVGGRLEPSKAVTQFTELYPGAGEADARLALADIASVDPRATEPHVHSRSYQGFDLAQTLRRLTCPVLLLAGSPELGSLVRDEDLEFFSTHTAHARATRVAGGGHGIVDGQPAQVINAEIADFCSSLK
jgi:pimeloyl-ACP methyl ester carboxylesterase